MFASPGWSPKGKGWGQRFSAHPERSRLRRPDGYIHAVQAADRDARISDTSDHFGEHVGKAGYAED